MKIRIYAVDVEVPKRFSRPATVLVLLAMAGFGIAVAAPKHTFVSNSVLKASDLNDNFVDLDARLSVLESGDAAWCPRLVDKGGGLRVYIKDTSTPGIVRCTSGADEMVKVGDFWIDRYEMSADGGTLGTGPGQYTTATASSVPGVAPLTSITWFQALALCANAGKHLCSNAQWQAAATGTPDPGASDGTVPPGSCVTSASGPRNTGGVLDGAGCRSSFGAEDMNGNLQEWVGDWAQAGQTWVTADGEASLWPDAGYNADTLNGVNGTVASGGAYQAGLPSAELRGGHFSAGTASGVFSLKLNHAPSDSAGNIGGRCCAGGL